MTHPEPQDARKMKERPRYPTREERAARKRFDAVMTLTIAAAKVREEAQKLTGEARSARLEEYLQLLKVMSER